MPIDPSKILGTPLNAGTEGATPLLDPVRLIRIGLGEAHRSRPCGCCVEGTPDAITRARDQLRQQDSSRWTHIPAFALLRVLADFRRGHEVNVYGYACFGASPDCVLR